MELKWIYRIKIAQKLPEDEKKKYLYENKYSVNDLVKRIETGKW